MEQQPSLLRSGLTCFLFIYVVQEAGNPRRRYCTVLAYGRTLEAAERIAINRVHQQHLHIVRADTATAASWLDPVQDRDYLAELGQYGSALRLEGGVGGREAGLSGTAADAA